MAEKKTRAKRPKESGTRKPPVSPRAKAPAAKSGEGQSPSRPPSPDQAASSASATKQTYKAKRTPSRRELAEERLLDDRARWECQVDKEADRVRPSLRAKVKRKPGRPTLYSPAMCDRVLELGAEGMEVVEFALEIGVARDTLYEWAKRHPEFSDALTRAREASEVWHIREIRRALQMPGGLVNVTPHLSYMGRRFTGWRDQADVAVTVTTPISVVLEAARKRATARPAARA